MTYESETVVRNGTVAVPSVLDGRRVQVIVIPIDDEPGANNDAIDRLFAGSVSGLRIEPLSREQAHERP